MNFPTLCNVFQHNDVCLCDFPLKEKNMSVLKFTALLKKELLINQKSYTLVDHHITGITLLTTEVIICTTYFLITGTLLASIFFTCITLRIKIKLEPITSANFNIITSDYA